MSSAITLTAATFAQDDPQAKAIKNRMFELQQQQLEISIDTYCIECHSNANSEADLNLEAIDFSALDPADENFDSAKWESIWLKLFARQMPPSDAERPDDTEYSDAIGTIERMLKRHFVAHPNPGRTPAIRRMTRTEYQNAIRDLLAIDFDATMLLPKDESSHGFDNITVNELSPTLLNRYITAAEKISALAIGSSFRPSGITIRLPADQTQEKHVAGLPLGTRGGTIVKHHFPQSGKYEIELRLMRDRDETVEGLNREHQIDILLDRKRVHQFTVKPPPGRKDYTHSDSHLKTRIEIPAGAHQIGITFPQNSSSLLESKRQPFDASYNRHRHPRSSPAIFQITIFGPFDPAGPGDTASRKIIFKYRPDQPSPENSRGAAEENLKALLRIAYRRSITDEDLETPLQFFDEAFAKNGFEAGMESALTAVLVNPNFLFRIIEQPVDVKPGDAFWLSDFEFASRLAFFLWSSIPDDELLKLAEQGILRDEETLLKQVERMLADPRSRSLATNFASQWLYLRNLDSITPDLRLFPDFDDNLRQAFRGESEHLFQHVLDNDGSVLELIDSDFTFLNERLAQHYGVPKIFGSQFRKVTVSPQYPRGGLLRHGSILTVTSYATRTSPTIRGNWILENIFGTPAPPPPANVPNLVEKTAFNPTSVRERLALHRSDPTCAACHDLMDPAGFAMENFDAIGRWRDFESTVPIDTAGLLPDGSKINGVEDLESAIMERPELFVRVVTEKLMTFGLGRGVDHHDGPAIREIIKQSGKQDFRFSSIIKQIVLSQPFRMQSAE